MLFRVLGPLEVRTDGGPVVLAAPAPGPCSSRCCSPPGARARASAGRGGLGGRRSRRTWNAVHSAVSRLRRALGPAGGARRTRPPGYLLDADPARSTQRSSRSCCGPRPPACPGTRLSRSAVLDEALGLWRGRPTASSPRASPARRRPGWRSCASRRARTARRRCSARAARRPRRSAAVDLAAEHPLRERPVELAMRALAATGRSRRRWTAYQRHRDHVRDELGLDPSPGLRDCTRGSCGRSSRPLAPPRHAPPGPRTVGCPRPPSPLVGRTGELGRSARLLAARPLVTLPGPGGVGKTRTALELAHRVAAAGRAVWWVDLVPVTARAARRRHRAPRSA